MGGPPVPTVGASGGIYGLLLAYGLYFPHQRVMLLIPPIPMKARTLVFVFAAIELFFGVTGRPPPASRTSPTWAACSAAG